MKQVVGCAIAFCLAAAPIGNIPMVQASGNVALYQQTSDQTNDQEVTAVSLSQSSKVVNKGEQFTLVATISPSNATNKIVTWSTSDATVATVTSGIVTAVGRGKAIITATTANGKTASCVVTVKVPSTSIVLSKTSATIYKGKTVTVKATMLPADSTDIVTYVTSDSKVAIVKNGVVKGMGKGTATITATTTSGKSAKCTITVKEVSAKSVKLNKKKVTIKKGKKVSLKANILPKTCTDDVVWKTSNSNVATVKNGVITGVKAGKATITVKVGTKSAKCTVTVNEIKATSIKISKSKVTTTVGQEVNLKATVKPSNTTDTVAWSTSNEKVATVENGVVKAIGKGKATITVKVGKKSAKCKVTVK